MSISINQQNSLIGIQTTQAQRNIETQQAKLLLRSQQPKINIHSEAPKVLIDTYDCRAEEGMKNMTDLTRENSDRAMQENLAYIGKVAADGDSLAAIENKGDPIVNIAVRDSTDNKEFGLVTMPMSRPKIEVTGSLDIQAELTAQGVTNGVEHEFQPGKIDINYTPGKVETYLRQKASIQITYENDKKIDVKV